MAEPVRTIPPEAPDFEAPDDEPGITLHRWVEFPDGRLEQVAMPLTPERFLYTQLEDRMGQGKRHADTARQIADLLERFFLPVPDVLVTFDMVHVLGPGRPRPTPDVAVIRGVRNRDVDRQSFDLVKEGLRPCLIVEVVSPLASRIRHTDLVAKVDIYGQAGIAEYLIVDSTRHDRRFRLLGYRLEGSGRSARSVPIPPDDQGRILSETTGLWFQISPEGDQVLLFEHPTGRPLLTSKEEQERRRQAEGRAQQAEGRAQRAEDEVARLRAELDRIRSQG